MTRKAAEDGAEEQVDVLIIGAGISGISAAYALSRKRDRTFLVLDAFESFGGTWLLHQFPGVRSDSDLFTYGFSFKPWRGRPIATGAEILRYLGEAIDENGLAPYFRYGYRIQTASWDSPTGLWHLEGRQGRKERPFRIACRFLWMCQGYYRHAEGYVPEWPGMAEFMGRIVHPQTWPDDLDYHGKRIVVIGSGATAATLVPALAPDAGHVTMLQRSPTYFSVAENRHSLAENLQELCLDDATTHEILRQRITLDQHRHLHDVRKDPDTVTKELLSALESWLTQDEIATHFTPTYRPWQQRVAVAPDGDLFEALKSGKASMVTDRIETFTPTGLALTSGRSIDADIIVTATGFELSMLGDISFNIDARPIDLAETVSYRGMMFTGVPNLARTIGYLRLSSWTLRAELVAVFVCRLLEHVDALNASTVEVRVPADNPRVSQPQANGDSDFNASYMMRSLHLMPRSGPGPEWQTDEYWREKDAFPAIDLHHEIFVYRDAEGMEVRGD